MFDGFTLAPAGTDLGVPPAPALPHPENLLLNPRFEHTDPSGSAWRRPAGWHASVCGPVAGAVTAACPAALTHRARHGAGVAWVYDGLHAPGVSRPPTILSQTLTLPAGAYRFGGRVALRLWDAALDPAGRGVLNASQAFLRLVLGSVGADAPRTVLVGDGGTLLGSIDLSPRRYAAGAFRRAPVAGALVRFAYLPFHTHALAFALDVHAPVAVTLQLGVVPAEPAEGGGGRLVPLTHLTLLADHVFVERTVA